MELVARGDGVLRKRLVGEGESRPVGQIIGVIATADENIDALVAGAGAPSEAAPAAQASAPAEAKPAEQVVATTRETAGASPVPGGGREAQGEASTPPQEKTPAPPPAQPSQASGAADGNGGQTRSSPLARRLASERGLDLSQVRGSGPGGRIIKRDIESAQAASAGAAPRPAAAAPAAGDFED